jgi:hypothetical protein
VAQVVAHLPSKSKALSSDLSTTGEKWTKNLIEIYQKLTYGWNIDIWKIAEHNLSLGNTNQNHNHIISLVSIIQNSKELL